MQLILWLNYLQSNLCFKNQIFATDLSVADFIFATDFWSQILRLTNSLVKPRNLQPIFQSQNLGLQPKNQSQIRKFTKKFCDWFYSRKICDRFFGCKLRFCILRSQNRSQIPWLATENSVANFYFCDQFFQFQICNWFNKWSMQTCLMDVQNRS